MRSVFQNSGRQTQIWIAPLVALAMLSCLAMRRSIGRAMGMRLEANVVASAQFRPGDEGKVVLEATRVASSSVEGNVLEKQLEKPSETVYRRTGNTVKIAFDSATPVVMGRASDIREGAVVHITAKMGDDRVLRAERIVVLTGYVKVEEQ